MRLTLQASIDHMGDLDAALPPAATMDGLVALVTGASRGIGTAIAERFTTGLASEVWGDNIAVNVLSPSGLVLTPGVVHHKLDKRVPVDRHEPASYMAEAAFALCSGDPKVLTGRVTYAKPLLEELGVPLPD